MLRKRSHNASKLYTKRCRLTKERVTALYRVLGDHQIELEQQGTESWLLRKTIKEEKAVADAEIEEYQRRQWKAYETSNREHARVRALLSGATSDVRTRQSQRSSDDHVQSRTRKPGDVDPRPLFSKEFRSCDPGLG